MSTDRETTRIVRSWLEDGVTALPDRVLDAVLDELPTTPQRRVTWWPVRRIPQMTSFAKIALGTAAVVLAAVLGITVLGGGGSVGGPDIGEPTPGPTVDAGANEALVRAWVKAANLDDGDALATMTADPVGFHDDTVDREDAIGSVLDEWCLITINSVEHVGDSVLVDVTWRDNADGTCVDAPPGTTGQMVFEVRDGKVVRIP
ncbi:MAG: hypothetical protein ACRDGD_08470 [Candidatus Limnocylindria bacterium]